MLSCCCCKYSIFYPTVCNYKCGKTGEFISDVCNDFKPREKNEAIIINNDENKEN